MKSTGLIIALSLAFGLAQGAPSPAPRQPEPPAGNPLAEQADRTAINDPRLMTARQLLRQNDYVNAARLLELLYEENAGSGAVANLLFTCYQQLKQLDKAVMLMERLVTTAPTNFGHRLSLAETLIDLKRLDEGRAAYDEARKLIPDSDRYRYQLLLLSQISRGLEADALALIASARLSFGDSTLFGLERGTILEKQGSYSEAVTQYVAVLSRDSANEGLEAESRLMAMLEFGETSSQVEKTLLQIGRGGFGDRIVRLLANYYIRVGRFDQAYEFAIRRDSAEGLIGGSLLFFMQQCYDRKEYAEAARMGEHVLAHYQNSPITVEASFVCARGLVQLGRLTEAVSVFDRLVAVSPRDQERGEALLQIGLIYLDHARDYPRALVYFDSVVNRFPYGLNFLEAQKARPICYLRMGDLEKARRGFTTVASGHLAEESGEEVAYYLALIDLFDGRTDSAEAGLRRLMVQYPRGFYVNDAVELVMTIEQARQSGPVLADFARAVLYTVRRLPDSSRMWYARVAAAEDRVLADVALYRLGTVSLALGDARSALEAADQLISGFDDSYYLPYGLKIKADLLAGTAETVGEARLLYKTILEKYPNYPFATEVRKKLRELEAQARVG